MFSPPNTPPVSVLSRHLGFPHTFTLPLIWPTPPTPRYKPLYCFANLFIRSRLSRRIFRFRSGNRHLFLSLFPYKTNPVALGLLRPPAEHTPQYPGDIRDRSPPCDGFAFSGETLSLLFFLFFLFLRL